METVKNVSLLAILPQNLLADENVVAVAKSLDVELQKLSAQTRLPLHLPRLDELPHEVLDELAWQYDALFYEPENMSLETKRRIVANSIKQWRHIGTPFAVREMLNNFAQGTEIEEWFDYEGGQPYHFKLLLKHLQDLEDNGETILRLINATKNVRSWIDAFDFKLDDDAEILHVAFAEILAGRLLYDLQTLFEEKQTLQVNSATLLHGENIYNGASTNNRDDLNLYVAFRHIQCGEIFYNREVEVDDDLWYDLWKIWLKWRWKDWNAAKIIWYTPDEPIDDDIIDEETFTGSYIKLVISYHNSDATRLMVFPFPREDVTADEINAIPVDGIFIKRGNLSDKIIRASLVEKTRYHMEF